MRCPTCGNEHVPESLQRAKAHFKMLTYSEQYIIGRLLIGHDLCGRLLTEHQPTKMCIAAEAGWARVLHDVMGQLSKPVRDALYEHGPRAVRAALGMVRDGDALLDNEGGAR